MGVFLFGLTGDTMPPQKVGRKDSSIGRTSLCNRREEQVKALMGFITAFSIPLMILNVLGGIASGIWLAVLRDWHTIGLGIGFFFVSSLLLGFVLLPATLLVAPAAYFADRGKMIGMVFFGTLSSIYTLAIMTVWCCGVLFLFVRDASAANLIPRLIWSYGVATAPWGYIASKEQGEGFSSTTLAVFLAEFAYLVVMVIVIFFSISLLGALKVFGSFMLVVLVVQITMVVLFLREHSRLTV
jgi:hypothetical protein